MIAYTQVAENLLRTKFRIYECNIRKNWNSSKMMIGNWKGRWEIHNDISAEETLFFASEVNYKDHCLIGQKFTLNPFFPKFSAHSMTKEFYTYKRPWKLFLAIHFRNKKTEDRIRTIPHHTEWETIFNLDKFVNNRFIDKLLDLKYNLSIISHHLLGRITLLTILI